MICLATSAAGVFRLLNATRVCTPAFVGGRSHLLRVLDFHGHRFLAIDVLARFHGDQRRLDVQIVRSGNIDHVHVWIFNHAPPIAIGLFKAQAAARLLGQRVVLIRNCIQDRCAWQVSIENARPSISICMRLPHEPGPDQSNV